MSDSSAPRHRGRFRNAHRHPRHGGWELLGFLGDWLRTPVRGAPPPLQRPDEAFLRGNRSVPTVTWLGHSTFLVQLDGLNLLTDPVLSPRASPFSWLGPRRYHPPALGHAQLPPIDVVLISHNHYDHLDAPTVAWLAKTCSPLFVAPLGHEALLRELGGERVVCLDWWQSHSRGGLKVTCVPAQHFSGRGVNDGNASLWGGFVFEAEGRRAYFAGDTGYCPHFAEIGERLGPMDLSLLPIGAYAPREFMAPMHVDPAEAVQIHRDVRSRLSVAMHWGAFRLTLEPLDEPPRRLAAALAEAGIPPEAFRVMAPGETLQW